MKKKLITVVVACTVLGALVAAARYWYALEGKQLVKQIRHAEHKPFFCK